MTNIEVAKKINILGRIMELHGENPFKIRSYYSAFNTIRRFPDPIVDLEREDLLSIKGIGQAIADKIHELRDTGELQTLNRYLDKTPTGIVEMINIKGLGPKRLSILWKNLGIETPGELMYACSENRLVEFKRFWTKNTG